MAQMQNMFDFPPAPKLDSTTGRLDRSNGTPSEIRGEDFFFGKAKCASCHPAPFYLDQQYHDLHRERFMANEPADGAIKAFTLRGIKESPPYLHHGRCLTLEDPVVFFNLVLQTKLNPQEKQFCRHRELHSDARNHNAVLGYSVSLKPTLLNELRIGYNRFSTFHFGQDYPLGENNILGIKNGNLIEQPESWGIASFSAALSGFGAPGWTNGLRRADTNQITNGTTWIRGAHTVKFGFNLWRFRTTNTTPSVRRGADFRSAAT